MDTFEREQQQKFMREIEEHKRQLESQQAQHSHILGKIMLHMVVSFFIKFAMQWCTKLITKNEARP